MLAAGTTDAQQRLDSSDGNSIITTLTQLDGAGTRLEQHEISRDSAGGACARVDGCLAQTESAFRLLCAHGKSAEMSRAEPSR